MLNAYRTAIGAAVALCLCGPALAAPNQTCIFGECGPYTPVQVTAPVAPVTPVATQTGARTISEHGSWSAVAKGETTMLIDHFDNGGEFGIAVRGDGKGDLLVFEPSWHLNVGQSFDIDIDVDGHNFSGKVVASDEQTLKLENVSKDFVTAMYNGRKATIRIDQYRASITLPDAAATMDDAVRYRQTSAR